MNTTINNKIACNEPHANLDSYYGPYESKAQALEALDTQTIAGVTYTKRAIGLTVGVTENGEVVEYWFKSGTTDNDLVKKITDSSIPQGVKIITFDGGDGVIGGQNSLLTDANGGVTLPQPAITRDGYTFECWSYNNHDYNPGDYIVILANTVVSAKWAGSQITYNVTFTAGNNISSVSGKYNGQTITSPATIPAGSSITLTAEPNDHCQFASWSGISGSTNPITVTVNSNLDIVANGAVETYWLKFSQDGEGIQQIDGFNTDTSETIETDHDYEYGTNVTLKPIYETDFGYDYWEGDTEGCTIDPFDGTISFILTRDMELVLHATVFQQVKFGWVGEKEHGFMQSTDEINPSDGNRVDIDPEEGFDAIYAVVPTGYKAYCYIDDTLKEMYPIFDKSGEDFYDEAYGQYVGQGWIQDGTSNIAPDTPNLSELGDVMYALINPGYANRITGIVIIRDE